MTQPRKSDFHVSIVIPAYNESGNLDICIEEIQKSLTGYTYDILFVDDGSSDQTLKELRQLSEQYMEVGYLSLSRNFGHQNALRAGLENAKGDCIISMDADMQHPPRLLPELIDKWLEGYDIVQTIRKGNEKLAFFKRTTSGLFYKFINTISEVDIEPGAADFRLIDRKVADVIRLIQDPTLFLRGLVPWMGFNQYQLEFEVGERHSGQSKYTFKKMLRLALDGIMAFSIRPLRLTVIMGLILSVAAFLYAIYALVIYLATDQAVSGWTSLVLSVLFIGGMQLFFLGIIGEYIGKIFIAIKQRPNYIIKETSQSK